MVIDAKHVVPLTLLAQACVSVVVAAVAWVWEIGKVLLTVLLFGVIFGFVRPIQPLAVFAGFIAAQLVVFGGLLVGNGAGAQQVMTKS